MRIEIDTYKLNTILESKTLTKILAKILFAFNELNREHINVEWMSFSMEDLRKSLGYKNKSTVSRGLKALEDIGVFVLHTNNQGSKIYFYPDRIRRI